MTSVLYAYRPLLYAIQDRLQGCLSPPVRQVRPCHHFPVAGVWEAVMTRAVQQWSDQLDMSDIDRDITDVVTSVIATLVDTIVPTVKVRSYPNQNIGRWIHPHPLNARNAAYNSGLVSGHMDE